MNLEDSQINSYLQCEVKGKLPKSIFEKINMLECYCYAQDGSIMFLLYKRFYLSNVYSNEINFHFKNRIKEIPARVLLKLNEKELQPQNFIIKRTKFIHVLESLHE